MTALTLLLSRAGKSRPTQAAHRLFKLVLLSAVVTLIPTMVAAEAPQQTTTKTCMQCHDDAGPSSVLSILETPHAVMADKRTPFAENGCVTCHGSSDAHMSSPQEGTDRAKPSVIFTPGSSQTVEQKNSICLNCHENGSRLHWRGSTHEFQQLSCNSCHTVHTEKDKVLETNTQPEVCFSCHKEQRAQMFRPSSHPVRDGKMACSDCHSAHGSNGQSLLVKSTLNETCYTCHAEKRGPFLWEHAPVREDCALCHKPHGSAHNSLLKNRTPFLCQQCHLAQFHPSTAYSGTGLPDGTKPSGAQQLLGKDCLNCHSQVHGSNHPSGPRKTR